MTAVILKPSKDTKWLTLEVCKDYAKGECDKNENECKFAHPPAHVEASNGKVICCFDSIKSKCQRTNPPCKYLHPPAHLRDHLLEMGRQNLIFKNLQLQSVLNSGLYQPVIAVSNSHNFTPHQNHPIAYPLAANCKTTMMPPSHQTLVLPPQQYEMPGPHPLVQQTAPTMPMQPYQLFGAPPQHSAMLSNGGMIQLMNPAPNFIYLNGASGPVSSPASLASINQSYPGVQILSYNDSLLQQQQQQQQLQQQYKFQQQQQQYTQHHQQLSNHWELKAKTAHAAQQHSRKRSYQSSSSPPSTSSSSSSSSLLMTSPDGNAADYLPCHKRPALVDLKGGLPIYTPHLPTPFPSNPPFIPISITQQSPYIHRI